MIRLRVVFNKAFLAQLSLAGLLLMLSSLQAVAQETQAQDTAALDRVGPLKLINFGIFAALVAWFLVKYAPRFFNARSADIQKAIRESTGLKIEADFRYSAIDKKVASLPDEVAQLRAQARIEMEREHERTQEQTRLEIGHMQASASNEIEALSQEASDRIQLHTAQLALGLAERRLQDQFAKAESKDSISDFVHLVDGRQN